MKKEKATYISDRIRLMIATKQFQVGEVLPSTRELGQQLETSFHTVRKAYQELAKEGLIESERGRGFVVRRQNTSLDKEHRLELGAEKIRNVIEELVGYGLSEDEVEDLFDEQLSFIEWPDRIESCATVGINKEHGQMIARAIREEVGTKSRVITDNDVDLAANYDALFVPLPSISNFKLAYEDIHLIPLIYSFDPLTLIELAERTYADSITLVTKEAETGAILLEMIQKHVPLPASVVAGTLENTHVPTYLKNADLVLYSPEVMRTVENEVEQRKRMMLSFKISQHTAELIRAELWDQ